MKLLMFTKHLQPLPVERMAATVSDLGFDGVDLTVRPNGSILPERVVEDLPELASVLSDHGLEIGMFTTALTDASEPHFEDTLRMASEHGVERIKLGYYRYESFGNLAARMEEIRARWREMVPLAERYGVTICVHTHAGDTIPASGEMLYMMLKGFDPERVAAYVDPGNMACEGPVSAWKMSIDLLADCTKLVAVKDFGFFAEEDAERGVTKWSPNLVPLRDGVVDWPLAFESLRAIGYDGYVSVASEYQGPSSWRDLSVDELIDQTRLDLEYLRPIVQGAAAPT